MDILKKKTMNALKFVVLSCLTVFGAFKFHMAVRKHALVYISLCTLMATGGIFIYGGISGASPRSSLCMRYGMDITRKLGLALDASVPAVIHDNNGKT